MFFLYFLTIETINNSLFMKYYHSLTYLPRHLASKRVIIGLFLFWKFIFSSADKNWFIKTLILQGLFFFFFFDGLTLWCCPPSPHTTSLLGKKTWRQKREVYYKVNDIKHLTISSFFIGSLYILKNLIVLLEHLILLEYTINTDL